MRTHKFNAKKITADVNGEEIVFDSNMEYRRYLILAELQKHGKIEELQIHVPYTLIPSFRSKSGKKYRELTYVADFVYKTLPNHHTVIEDVKGFKTPEYMLKKKLFAYVIGDDISEIDRTTIGVLK